MLNHIDIGGRLTRDPELRYTQSQVAVCSFSVAVERDYAPQGQQKETDFFDCVVWRQGAEFVSKYFHKGSMIIVSGRMQSRRFQDREGNNRTAWDIQADNVYFGESKRDSEAGSYSQSSYGNSFGSQSGNYSGYNSAPQSAPAPQVSPSPYEELEDDGELPF